MKTFLSKTYANALRDLTALGGFSLTILLPLLILSGNPIRLIVFVYIGLLILEIIVSVIKFLFFKNRPIPEAYDDVVDKVFCSSSFPSSHVARSTFLFYAFFHIYDENIILLLPIVLVMLTRYLLSKHYILDIIAGFIISLIFSLIYWNIIFNYL